MTRCQQDLEIIYSSKQERKKHLCGDSQGSSAICEPCTKMYEGYTPAYVQKCAELDQQFYWTLIISPESGRISRPSFNRCLVCTDH
jgi:hypothetical protein